MKLGRSLLEEKNSFIDSIDLFIDLFANREDLVKKIDKKGWEKN